MVLNGEFLRVVYVDGEPRAEVLQCPDHPSVKVPRYLLECNVGPLLFDESVRKTAIRALRQEVAKVQSQRDVPSNEL